MESIHIQGARVNNLKHVSLDIPRGKLVVVTGVSGSGKSSLAFDTLYAEGQRRYVESLNSYARQFLGRMSKPECDYITGLPPAIAIEQKVISRNPRSTVGTSTEVYEYLRLLYARVGHTISPISGQEVKKHSTEDVVRAMQAMTEGEHFVLLAPIRTEGRLRKEVLRNYMSQGYARVEIQGNIVRIDELLDCDDAPLEEGSFLVVDRLTARGDDKATISRLVDSCETALYEGRGEMALRTMTDGRLQVFSTRFEADGMTFEEPSDTLFAFNSAAGACPTCQGWGNITGIDPHLVIPNTTLSVYEGCVVCWRGEVMKMWKEAFIEEAERTGFPIFTPYLELTQEQLDLLWHGRCTGMNLEERWQRHDVCIDLFFDSLKAQRHKIQNRVMVARFTGKTECPDCHGGRLRKEASYVKVGGRAITELVAMPIVELQAFFEQLQLSEHEEKVAHRLLTEIKNRLQFLVDVGLGYLTLGRRSNSLSGGESQRINLATSLGSSLVGSLYILDEPSIGLHSRDTQRLIRVLRQLVDLGNTVVVVEHDREMMEAADWLVDIGPDAGRLGGQIVYSGPRESEGSRVLRAQGFKGSEDSYTLRYLEGKDVLAVPESRRPWNRYIEVLGARANNLRGLDARFPLNVMTVVTGVSGSGKSTLVRDILFCALRRHLDVAADRPGEYLQLTGDFNAIGAVEFVDQNPIGKSSRSNPVIYVKAYDEIRRLFADQPLSRQMGFTASYFSFNTEGGRCEECKGEGTVTVEMQFMADLVLECESCHGERFKKEILEVRFHDQNINDVLNMTVNQAIEFFAQHGEKKIARRLKPLQDVGLGYIKLGQTSSTLSGGENQRVKLAYYIGMEKTTPTLFIFDEPTTGLHFHDIQRLMTSFNALIERGHTILIIEHNMDVIKMADHVIDLGPEGGNAGGTIVATGTPEEIARCEASHTGRMLRAYLEARG